MTTEKIIGFRRRAAILAVVFAVLVFTVLVFAGPAAAQFEFDTRDVTKSGTTAAEFLRIPVGARATAMGGALTAMADDGTSIYWNPAGLANASGAFRVEYADWLAEINFGFISVVLPTSFGTIGVGVTSMTTQEMDVTTGDAQDGTGQKFDAASYAISLSYGRALTDRFSLGATVKVITERIWNSSATGFAFDIGTLFVTPFAGIRLGAAILNFGTKMQISGDDLLIRVDIDPNSRGNNNSNRAHLSTDEFDLPLTMRVGLAGEVFQSDRTRLTLSVEALNPNNSKQYVNMGAELGFLNDLVMIRAGYAELFLDNNLRSVTMGAGLKYRFQALTFIFDYSYEVQKYFADVNRFALSIHF